MGKKVRLVTLDPILSQNFKHEKRKKEKMAERLKTEEERAAQTRRKREMVQVESKVDRDIEHIAAKIAASQHKKQGAHQQDKFFSKTRVQESAGQASTRQLQELLMAEQGDQADQYGYHFGLEIAEEWLEREKKVDKKQKIEKETRSQIQSMFGVKEDSQMQQQAEEENKNEGEIYNLARELKKQRTVSLAGQSVTVSKLAERNLKNMETPADQKDSSLALAGSLVHGYFDHVYIDGQQEQKIDSFRSIVISHAHKHLERCNSQEKARGFTNCKVLILTPFLGDAKAIADLIEEAYPGYEIANKQKMDQFPDENDFFRIGLKLAHKKKKLTYFSSFDHSQIIITSPVGLKSIIGSQGDSKRQNSFISSVELFYVDRASVMLMQNWSHLTQIYSNMNFMPRYESLKNSIDSIRDSFLQLKGRLFRQNIVFSQFGFPELNALRSVHFHNIQGAVSSKLHYPLPGPLPLRGEQQFFKIELKQASDDLSVRLEYFKRKFWEELHNKETFSRVVIFANSYFEYVQLKAFFEKVNASAQSICEHTSAKKVQSRLARFNNNQYRILLLTERAYYFEVCQVRKLSHLYFYSLPRNPFIFQQLLSQLEPSSEIPSKIVSIYTKFDMMILERLVGTSKAHQMVQEYCSNVSFLV